MLNCFYVGLGGFIGAVCRYWMSFLPLRAQNGFPFSTLLVNVTGALAIGVIAALAARSEAVSPGMVLFIKVGLCGGFTTFSSFSLETTALLQNGSVGVAIAYVALSVVFCVVAVFGAQLLVK